MSTSFAEQARQGSAAATGRLARIIGPVVDIEFPEDAMPDMYNLLYAEVDQPGGRPVHR